MLDREAENDLISTTMLYQADVLLSLHNGASNLLCQRGKSMVSGLFPPPWRDGDLCADGSAWTANMQGSSKTVREYAVGMALRKLK
jgi:hypothetical protein